MLYTFTYAGRYVSELERSEPPRVGDVFKFPNDVDGELMSFVVYDVRGNTVHLNDQ